MSSATPVCASACAPPDAALLERLIESLPGVMLLLGADRRIRYRTNRAASWIGDSTDAAEALREVQVLEPFQGWAHEVDAVLRTGVTRHAIGFCRSNAAERRLVEITLTRLTGGDPQVQPAAGAAVVLHMVEASQRTMLDQQLEGVERLAALGKLAARVAHELNNPLDGILRYINLAARLLREGPPEQVKDYLDESRTGLKRMARIVGDLLQCSRGSPAEPEPADLNDVVEQALLAHAAPAEQRNVVVCADYQQRELPGIRGGRLYQVCCNLIKNALDAMPAGGRLTVTTGRAGDWAVVRVADSGPGLPLPVERNFEPFFTTKPPGEGTGLGLAIAREFVQDLGGTITAENGPEGGAVLTVRVPLGNAMEGRPRDVPRRADGKEKYAADVRA